MAYGQLVDVFRDRHRFFFTNLASVRVSFDKSRDRLRLVFRANARLPSTWLQGLRIVVHHDLYLLQETVETEWPDIEGSHLVATCPRPRRVLPDAELELIDEDVVPIGDVILFAGNGAHEHVLHNLASRRIYRARAESPRGRNEVNF